jgi:hypothetical protein
MNIIVKQRHYSRRKVTSIGIEVMRFGPEMGRPSTNHQFIKPHTGEEVLKPTKKHQPSMISRRIFYQSKSKFFFQAMFVIVYLNIKLILKETNFEENLN